MNEENFPAKRRNLIASTFVLLFIKYADAKIEGAATISVLKFEVGRPEAILQAIWALWAYFFIRAYQHYSYYLHNEYRRSIQKSVIPLMHPYVSGSGVPEERERFFFDSLERFHNYDLDFRPQFVFELAMIWVFRLRNWLNGGLPKKKKSDPVNLLRKPVRYGQKNFRLRRLYGMGDAWRVTIWTITDRSIVGAGKLPIEVVNSTGLSLFRGLLLKAKILFTLFFKSAVFFEYRLPFLFAFTPLAYYGWTSVQKLLVH